MDRRTLCWAAALALLATALCFVPLLGRLGFEASLVLCLAAALPAADLGARAPSLAVGARRALLVLAAPIVVLALDGLRVKVCDWWLALQLTALLPGVGVVVAATWGRAGRVLLGGPVRGLLAALAAGLASLAHTVWLLYAEPPVFAYDPVLGHWPGALYDEALGVPAPLVPARILHVLAALAALAVAQLLAAPVRRRTEPGLLLPPPALLAAVAVVHASGPSQNFRHASGTVVAALGRTVRAEGATLHADRSLSDDDIAALLDDLTWRRRELGDALGMTPGELPVPEVFAYASRAQRRRLMGADVTTIAKPWSHQVHLARPEPGSVLVAHELVHVLAADLAGPVTGLPWRDGLPVMGLVEGLAVALAGKDRGPGLHEAVAGMRRAGVAPAPAALLGLTGFYAQPGSRAYAVMGSFVRFLLDRHGPGPLREAYRTGDLAGAVGAPLSDLTREWEAMVDALPVPPDLLARAELLYRRGAVFERVCPHEVALRRREAAGRSDPRAAVRAWESIVAWDPGDPGHLLNLAAARLDADDPAGAAEAATRCRESPAAPAALRTAAELRLADLAWLEGRRDEALAAYRGARGRAGAGWRERLVRAKLLAAERGEAGDAVRDYLLERVRSEVALLDLQAAAVEGEGWGLPAYLLGRRLYGLSEWSRAAQWLARAAELGVGDPLLTGEDLRLLGRALHRAGRAQEAAAAFTRLWADAPTRGYQEGAAAWLGRLQSQGVPGTPASNR